MLKQKNKETEIDKILKLIETVDADIKKGIESSFKFYPILKSMVTSTFTDMKIIHHYEGENKKNLDERRDGLKKGMVLLKRNLNKIKQ